MFDIGSAFIGGALGLMTGVGFTLAAGLLGLPSESSEGDRDPDLAEPLARCMGRQSHLYMGHATCQRCGIADPKYRAPEPVLASTEGQVVE